MYYVLYTQLPRPCPEEMITQRPPPPRVSILYLNLALWLAKILKIWSNPKVFSSLEESTRVNYMKQSLELLR